MGDGDLSFGAQRRQERDGFLAARLGGLVMALRQVLLAQVNEHAADDRLIAQSAGEPERLLLPVQGRSIFAHAARHFPQLVGDLHFRGQITQSTAHDERPLQDRSPCQPEPVPLDERPEGDDQLYPRRPGRRLTQRLSGSMVQIRELAHQRSGFRTFVSHEAEPCARVLADLFTKARQRVFRLHAFRQTHHGATISSPCHLTISRSRKVTVRRCRL